MAVARNVQNPQSVLVLSMVVASLPVRFDASPSCGWLYRSPLLLRPQDRQLPRRYDPLAVVHVAEHVGHKIVLALEEHRLDTMLAVVPQLAAAELVIPLAVELE